MVRLLFLGTGASGGTGGEGRSLRLESSLVVEGEGGRLLLDVTRDFPAQSTVIERLDAALLTHAHRDASGGIPALARWLEERGEAPLPVYGHPRTLARLLERHGESDRIRYVEAPPGARRRLPGWRLSSVEVPHAADPGRYPTVAWRLSGEGKRIVYASDVGELTPGLRRLARGADVLVLDGATFGRRIFSHLRIDQDLPEVCGWPVVRILLTQIGKSAPPHPELEEVVRQLCPRAAPAFDGMVVEL